MTTTHASMRVSTSPLVDPALEPRPAMIAQAAAALGDLLLELDTEGRCLRAEGNSELLDAGRGSPEGKTLGQWLPATTAEAARQAVREALRSHGPHVYEWEIPTSAGPRYIEARIGAGPNDTLFLCLRDIRLRFLAQSTLRESEARFRVMADCSPVMLWKADRSGECDFFNRGWLDFTGRGLDSEVGVGWTEGLHPEDFEPCMNVYMAALVARRSFRMEYRLRRSDSNYRWILDHGVPRFSVDGEFEGYIGSCIDVTEIKQAAHQIGELNAALQRRVREREVLLREIHHRVKNNLQLISSILSLQARLLDGHARSVMEEGQLRVRSIALVHEKLCESDAMGSVDLGQYVRDLVSVLRHAVLGSSHVEVTVEIPTMQVSIDRAIPCGLVINEIVTNAFKHAFPDGRNGEIRIEVIIGDSGAVKLCVGDNGIGLAPEIDWQNPKTLGLDLIATLTRQLEAQLSLERRDGTRFTLDFVHWRSHGTL